MKTYLIAFLLLTTLTKSTFAGDKIKLGIKVSPVISFASVKDKDTKDQRSFNGQGNALKFVVGPFLDFAINDNVYFSLGVWYSPRTVRLSHKYLDTLGNVAGGTSQYNLQYIMVPLYFKFYTNEISEGLKLYFTLGASADFKIAEKNIGDNDPAALKEDAAESGKQLFSFFDSGLLLGAGVEYKIGGITTVYGGFSYNRGLTNIVNPLLVLYNSKPYQYFSVKNNLVGIDLGVKF